MGWLSRTQSVLRYSSPTATVEISGFSPDEAFGLLSRVIALSDLDVRPWRPSDGDTRCQQCGRPNVVWSAPHDLWNEVMPNDGVLCPLCFMKTADAVENPPLAWSIQPLVSRASDVQGRADGRPD